jgi:hypothetical protein
MTFHSKLVKPVTLIIQAVAEEIAKHKLTSKMTSEQIMNLLNLDDMSVSFSGKSTPAKKDDLPEWKKELGDLPGGILKKRALALLALAQAGVPDGFKIHTQKAELFKLNKQHAKFYTKGVFSGPEKEKEVIKWLCKQGEFGAPPEPDITAELPMHKWEGDKKKAAKLLKLVQAHKKKAEEEEEEYKYVSWDTSRGHKKDDSNFLYNTDYEICGPKEFKSEFLNLIAWLDENADFVEKSRKETSVSKKGKKASESDETEKSESSESVSEKPKKPAAKGRKAAKPKESESEESESSEKPKGRKAQPKKAAKESSEDSEESEKPKVVAKGRKAQPKKVAKEESEESSEESEESSEESEKPKAKGRNAQPKKVVKENIELSEESDEKSEMPQVAEEVDPDADIDDKVVKEDATIEMDDDDESSCDEVEKSYVMGYDAIKVQKFKAKLAKLLETENDKYLNAKTGFEISRNEKSELKFQWIEAHKIAVPNDFQQYNQEFVDMITK